MIIREMKISSKSTLAKTLLFAIAVLILSAMPVSLAAAQELSIDLGSDAGNLTDRVVQLLALLTILSLAPSILIMVTSFVRIVVVLSLLRTAMGLQQSPPNPVVVSLALFLTAFIMAPVFNQAYESGIEPYINDEVEFGPAFEEASQPFKSFMLANVREKDLLLFVDLADAEAIEEPAATPFHILIPAFMISELRRAFEIGFLIFIPFLVIDMVIASVLMSMGMMMLPPIIISLPFKLVFFVLVDGWHMIAGSLVQSFKVI